jgi:hypothetical protein
MHQLTVYGVDGSSMVLDDNLILARGGEGSLLYLQRVGLGLRDVCGFVRHDG